MKKNAKPKATKQVFHVCLPYEDPQTASNRLEAVYGAAEAADLLYVDMLDADTGDVVPMICGMDDTFDPPALIPIAKWLTADEVLNKAWKVWDASGQKWVPIKETGITREGWHALKYEE